MTKQNRIILVLLALWLPFLAMSGESTVVGLGGLGALPDNTSVTMAHDVTVIASSLSGVYVTDETGFGILKFGNNSQTPEYNYGDVIPAGFQAVKTTYDSEPMLISPTGLQDVTETGRTVPYEEITCSQMNHEHWAHLVVIRNVKINKFWSTGIIVDPYGKSCVFKNEYGVTFPDDEERHDLYGIVASKPHHANTDWYELWPVSIDVVPHGVKQVAGINELVYRRPPDSVCTFLAPLTAAWQNDRFMVVKDIYGSIGIVHGAVVGDFVDGDLIHGAQASWNGYNDGDYYAPCPFLIPVDSTFVPSGHGAPVEPQYLTVKEIKNASSHYEVEYAAFNDVKVNRYEPGWFIENSWVALDDGTGTMSLINVFGIPLEVNMKESLDDYIGTFYEFHATDVYKFASMMLSGECVRTDWLYNVKGCLIEHNYFYPTEVTPTGTYQYFIGDLNEDGELNIADLNALIHIIL